MNNWQTELVKELKSILKGFQESGSPTNELELLIKQLDDPETPVDEHYAIGVLRKLGLGYFASHVEVESFHKRADIANAQVEKTEYTPNTESEQ